MKYATKREKKILILLIAMLVAVFIGGLMLGSAELSPIQMWEGICGIDDNSRIILCELRLPRVIGALLSGMALSVSGILLQSATGNDLCSQSVLGINSGAGLAVIISICFLPQATGFIPAFSFAGALLTAFLVIGIADSVEGHSGKISIVLSGVAVSAFFNALIGLFTSLFPDNAISYSGFTSGGFSGTQIKDLIVPGLLILIGLILSAIIMPKLNILMVGDDVASTLGIKVVFLRMLAIILASLLCAASISFAGLIGFVGLLVPHMARKLFHRDYRVLFGASLCIGAILVTLADLLGRTVFAPSEISAGILLSVIGAPFFVVILYRRQQKK